MRRAVAIVCSSHNEEPPVQPMVGYGRDVGLEQGRCNPSGPLPTDGGHNVIFVAARTCSARAQFRTRCAISTIKNQRIRGQCEIGLHGVRLFLSNSARVGDRKSRGESRLVATAFGVPEAALTEEAPAFCWSTSARAGIADADIENDVVGPLGIAAHAG